VVWKITPLFAIWITTPSNLLFKHGILNANSTVLELGCGISGIIGLSLGPSVRSYTLTDQDYVSKLLSQNLEENHHISVSGSRGRKSNAKSKKGAGKGETIPVASNVLHKSLDWETDEVTASLTGVEKKNFDVVIACDCIYNDALINPLVQTSIEACRLRLADEDADEGPTICLVAQQLRSAEVFEGWLKVFHDRFRVWRIPDKELIDGLKTDSGFVVHIGILRE
jgi:hypothetical protein